MDADGVPSEKYAEFGLIPKPEINVCAEILVSIYCQQKQSIDLMNTEFSLKFIDQLRAFEANNFQLVESISRAESQLEAIYKQRKELQVK